MKICIYGATQILTPALNAVLALVAQRAKIAGLYGMSPPVKAKSPRFCMIAPAWSGALAFA
jgi:hypothetical protein